MNQKYEDYLRSAIFGLEDSLVSTTGVVVGISTGVTSREFIILACLVTVAVEAVSMAAGQYLSERTIHQLDKHNEHRDNLVLGAVIMFFCYLLGGAVPVLPVLYFEGFGTVIFSLIFAFTGLFLLGFIKGKLVKVPATRSALEMLFIGGVATIIGAVVGYLLRIH